MWVTWQSAWRGILLSWLREQDNGDRVVSMALFVVTRLEVVVGSWRRAKLAPVTFPCTPFAEDVPSRLIHKATCLVIESNSYG